MVMRFVARILFIFSAVTLVSPNLALSKEVKGSSAESIRLCVKSLIDAELQKNNLRGIEITEVSMPILSPRPEGLPHNTGRYTFVGYGLYEHGLNEYVRYSGRILAQVARSSTKTICNVGAGGMNIHVLGCSEGCPVETFELSAELLRYSGDKSRSLLYE